MSNPKKPRPVNAHPKGQPFVQYHIRDVPPKTGKFWVAKMMPIEATHKIKGRVVINHPIVALKDGKKMGHVLFCRNGDSAVSLANALNRAKARK